MGSMRSVCVDEETQRQNSGSSTEDERPVHRFWDPQGDDAEVDWDSTVFVKELSAWAL
eukprot:CAMPEP_0171115582 /NCGR_PEP_ID=MMETSP0766_2-20121228/88229_1 /TAXON_ID=439317 /ORGANISM="Gambierdiscus australes, Strain CAWD 149" /LENGTH=57 /DNA_ID=CAMNT_0011577955 /DNA_START=107 /DNA_END=276 /DNA_ORIENTATION=-